MLKNLIWRIIHYEMIPLQMKKHKKTDNENTFYADKKYL